MQQYKAKGLQYDVVVMFWRNGSWSGVAVVKSGLPTTAPSSKERLDAGTVAVPSGPQTVPSVWAAVGL
jgi:hypothetical protein